MGAFATVDDVKRLFRPLSDAEKARVWELLPVVSDRLRQEAINRGKDLDKMIKDGLVLESVVMSVCVDVVSRTIMTSTNSEPMTQMSESANGYSMSGSFLNPGGGVFVKDSELVRLRIKTPKVDAWSLFGGA